MLTVKRCQYMANVFDQMNDAVTSTVELHNVLFKTEWIKHPDLLNTTYLPYNGLHNHLLCDGVIAHVHSSKIEVEWEEYALGCRTDSGSYYLSFEELCEDTREAAIRERVDAQVEQLIEQAKKRKAILEDAKVAEYKRLKREIGIDED